MDTPAAPIVSVPAHAICMGVLLLAGLSACQTDAQKARNTELAKPAAPEMNRICALHGDERVAELKKLKEQTGLDLYCPND